MGNELILLPSLTAQRGPNGGLVLTRKYVEGAAEYARCWPGPVTSLLRLDTHPTTDMDHVEYHPGDAETGLELRPDRPEALAARLADAALVVGFLARNERPTLALCHRLGLPVVLVSEYSARTERQILAAEHLSLPRHLRRLLWLWRTERIRRGMLRHVDGLQCSGTPTYEAYHGICPDTLLFFDNRVRGGEVISAEALHDKETQIAGGGPLRLVFGGRLVAMKGVDDLPKVAAELVRLGVDFRLEIYGGGPLEQELARQIAARGLQDRVRLGGVLDFQTGWIPHLRRGADLFLCCHPQGDPSSTYPEVMSCGVPIIGYANDALRGIVAQSGSGWTVPIGDTPGLARRIAALASDRDSLAAHARAARDFAAQHVFELTFGRRVAHFIRNSRLPEPLRQTAA
ncbi:glycosyltransferase [Paracoccus limosus]|uniref:Glycosyltransferase n=1 Tax=Paracoccus limosus TaxID=913252 RepID=A0A844H3N8_9RHOB|nr:glycosyltransferase family 4 protein [Paracoccus limosus]MTH34090.1 glycosyltransferase [Paracoccus limosus]